METKVSCDQALDKLSEKLNSRLLVQEDHGFQRWSQCAPWPQEHKKKPGLDRVKSMHECGQCTSLKDNNTLPKKEK